MAQILYCCSHSHTLATQAIDSVLVLPSIYVYKFFEWSNGVVQMQLMTWYGDVES